MLDELGRYVIQDGEAGVAVYRIAHQSLADHIRPPFPAQLPASVRPAGPAAVAAALLARYQELLAGGVPATAPGYLWRYAWRHAAAAGPDGLELLRDLAADEPQLLPDVAMAAGEVPIASRMGLPAEARAPPRKPSGCTGSWPPPTPPSSPTSPSALNNLGNRYSEVGRRQDALAPAEEAVQLHRELAAANPAFLPDLATALNNLGIRYSEVGRRQDALAPTEEAVQLRPGAGRRQPRLPPRPRQALNNLGIRYGEVGRRQDALAAAEEAVQPAPRAGRRQPRLPARPRHRR